MKLPSSFIIIVIAASAIVHTQSSAQVAAPVAPASPTVSASPSVTPRMPRTPESAITPLEKDPKRHRQLLDRVRQGEIDLLFIGDSITDFWNRVGEKSWLKFASLRPANLGVSADRTEHVLWRLEHGEIDGIQPKLAVILIGTNNLGQNPDEQPEWDAAGIKKIVDTVRTKLPETRILLLAIFPRGDARDPLRQRVAKVNEIIATYADNTTIRFLDLGKTFLDENGNIPAGLMPDKLHPSATGYDKWYEAVRPAIDEMMK